MRNASSRRVIWTRTVPSTKKKLRNWSSSLNRSMAVQAEAMGRVGNVLLALIAHSDRNSDVRPHRWQCTRPRTSTCPTCEYYKWLPATECA